MVSHSSGKGPGNPSSFRQLPEAVGQKTKRTVNEVLKKENTLLQVSSRSSATFRPWLCCSVLFWRRSRACDTFLVRKAKWLTLEPTNVKVAGDVQEITNGVGKVIRDLFTKSWNARQVGLLWNLSPFKMHKGDCYFTQWPGNLEN